MPPSSSVIALLLRPLFLHKNLSCSGKIASASNVGLKIQVTLLSCLALFSSSWFWPRVLPLEHLCAISIAFLSRPLSRDRELMCSGEVGNAPDMGTEDTNSGPVRLCPLLATCPVFDTWPLDQPMPPFNACASFRIQRCTQTAPSYMIQGLLHSERALPCRQSI